ncbi:unnamed protein product [Danaus chrysippus]|uniref:(African queen) hypothetical protein n=1 Tax=Danaus chrysippus TaxID=151541 RepID=A0A8J2QKX9_9NEOP|nr:unnamed protein product [Danaus chrysippus]
MYKFSVLNMFQLNTQDEQPNNEWSIFQSTVRSSRAVGPAAGSGGGEATVWSERRGQCDGRARCEGRAGSAPSRRQTAEEAARGAGPGAPLASTSGGRVTSGAGVRSAMDGGRQVWLTGAGGKDVVMVASRAELAAPSTVSLPEPEPAPGLLLADGSINWGCPCLGGMATGPCGTQFRDAFSCFHYSEADPKGSDCYEKFSVMQECMSQYPELYGKDEDEDLAAALETAGGEASREEGEGEGGGGDRDRGREGKSNRCN